MSNQLTVTLSTKSYPIHFGVGSSQEIRKTLSSLESAGRKVAILTDQNVWAAMPSETKSVLQRAPRLELPPGEKTKSLANLGLALDHMATARLDRSSVLLVIGGGVIGDLGGFAASAYLRGIEFIQLPTTLLAMVDSSIGGKTGINITAGKNLVGAFHHPSEVFIDPALLRTLPAREFAAGMAEVIKYGLLGDAQLFSNLEKNPVTVSAVTLTAVIHRCCAMKAEIVQADEKETAKDGGRALLNLGHTFGHAIEQVTGYASYLHGEAVAVGLVAAAKLSGKLGYISAKEINQVEQVLTAHGLPIRLQAPLARTALMEAMQHDKKVRAGKLRFVVLKRIGEAATQSNIESSLVESVWRELGAN